MKYLTKERKNKRANSQGITKKKKLNVIIKIVITEDSEKERQRKTHEKCTCMQERNDETKYKMGQTIS